MQVQTAPFIAAPETTEAIFSRVLQALGPPKPIVCVDLSIHPYCTTMGKLALHGDRLDVRLSDLMAAAPATVREALAWILVSKLFGHPVPAHWHLHYRQFMMRRDVRRTCQLVRQARGHKYLSGPQGEVHNLDTLFDSLRDRYFEPLLPKPDLGWSRRPSRSLLGHFDYTHNAIIISRRLDGPDVPVLVVEYVLYHEMLHLKHPVEHRGSRRRVHTAAFRQDEKLFLGFAEARAWLRNL